MKSLDFSSSNERQKLVWMTDLHLDAADKPVITNFFKKIKKENGDFVLVTGDISNGLSSLVYLHRLAEYIDRKIFFVLGNHDYYLGTIEETRLLAKRSDRLCYLTEGPAVFLQEKTALVGHDGWADGREGDFLKSTILLNDYVLIKDLKGLDKQMLLEKIQEFGDRAAASLQGQLESLPEAIDHILVATHAPPFKEACLYQGTEADSNWSPHFVCQAVGTLLRNWANDHPEKKMLVLCGHSHNGADVEISSNLRVVAGSCTLGQPEIDGIIWI